MSDISDVLAVFATQINTILYPNGTGQPSVTGGLIRVYPGWATASTLDPDAKAGITNVTVFPSGQESNKTRYSTAQKVQAVATPTLSLTVTGGVVTVGGVMPIPFTAHNLAVLVNNAPYIYSIQPSDTLTTIATALASLIAAGVPGTTSSGAAVTLPVGVNAVVGRVGTTGTVSQEWERQAQRIQITIWAPDPVTRNAVSAPIKQALAQIAFFSMPDGYGARVRSVGGAFSDALEKATTYRRDLFYEVEYATTSTSVIATVVAAEVTYDTPTGVPLVNKTY